MMWRHTKRIDLLPEGLDPVVAALIRELERPSARRSDQRVLAPHKLGQMRHSAGARPVVFAALRSILDKEINEGFLQRLPRAMARPFIVTIPTSFPIAAGLAAESTHTLKAIVGVFASTLLISTLLAIVSLPVAIPWSLAQDVSVNNQVRAAAAGALGHLGYREAIGPLCRNLDDLSPTVRDACYWALRKVLVAEAENVSEERLSSETSGLLARTLQHPDEELVRQALLVLEKRGTQAALAAVANVARSGRTEKLRLAADAALQAISERVETDQASERLLRPAERAEAHSALLRPVRSGGTPEAKALLRPTTSEDA
jgi:hypothetical protein